jgi:hypothetical protein
MERDAAYFTRRANEERAAAMRAAHPTARKAHLEMAERYRERSAALTAGPPVLGPDIISVA